MSSKGLCRVLHQTPHPLADRLEDHSRSFELDRTGQSELVIKGKGSKKRSRLREQVKVLSRNHVGDKVQDCVSPTSRK